MKMRNLILAFSFCLLSLPILAEGAGTDGAKHAKLTAPQIVARNIQARGGLKRWRAIHSISMAGKMDAGKIRPREPEKSNPDFKLIKGASKKARLEMEKIEPEDEKNVVLPFVMEMARPRKMRLEITFQGQTAIQVFDGVHGWKVRPFLGRNDVEPYTPDEMRVASEQQDLDGPLVDYAAKGTKVRLEGIEKVEGNDAYKLRLTLKNGAVRYIWIDMKTFLDVKIDGSRRLDGKLHQVSTYFHDYKTVGGLKIPFMLETSVEGVKDTEKIAIEQVMLNPKLNAARFAKPQV